MRYHGRFAPSPTGPLHFGSLLAALASYLDAKAHQGTWSIRIEDIDPPREMTGASEYILSSLSSHGLESDIPIVYQSKQSSLYEDTLSRLLSSGLTFKCPCSRTYLTQHKGVHREDCRNQHLDETTDYAHKFRRVERWYSWQDRVQGYCANKIKEPFVLKRKDGLYAYQLAVVTDDIKSKVTDVVRGSDLLESTPMQLALYSALNQPPPNYAHIPILLNTAGQKLSKQNLAPAVNPDSAIENLKIALRFFDIHSVKDDQTISDILTKAIREWSLSKVAKCREFDLALD